MDTFLHVTALVVAVLSIPTVAGLTAWGLAGGDGEPPTWWLGVLGALVALGSVYVALSCWTAFFDDLPAWRWWLMLVPPAAGLLGLVLGWRHLAPRPGSGVGTGWRDVAVGAGMQATLAVPALLLLAAGVVDV